LVLEVIRPNRRARRRNGKSDPADADAAATAVLSGEVSGLPQAGDGAVEMIRVHNNGPVGVAVAPRNSNPSSA
jgi:transposase